MCLVSLRSICIFQQLFCVLFAHLVGNYKNRTTFNHNLAAKSGELPCPGISVPQIHFDSHLIFANFWLLLPSPAFRSLAKWLSNCCGSKLGTGSPGHDHQWLISQPGTDDGPKKKKKRPPSTPRSRLQMSKGITRNEEWQIEWRSDFKVEESGKWEREKEKRLYCIN